MISEVLTDILRLSKNFLCLRSGVFGYVGTDDNHAVKIIIGIDIVQINSDNMV